MLLETLRKLCGGSNLSTVLVLWGIYSKKCISLVRICLQTRNARNASTKFRKTLESKKTEKSLEISVFLLFSCLHLNQTLIMAGVAGFGPTNARVKVWCLTAWLYPKIFNFCPFFSERSYYIIFFPYCQELYFIFVFFLPAFPQTLTKKEAGSIEPTPFYIGYKPN